MKVLPPAAKPPTTPHVATPPVKGTTLPASQLTTDASEPTMEKVMVPDGVPCPDEPTLAEKVTD